MSRSRWIVAALLVALLVLPAGALLAKDLNFALSGNPDTLDPHKTSGTLTFQTLKSIYDTLAEADQTGKLVPALAESWTVSADSLDLHVQAAPGRGVPQRRQADLEGRQGDLRPDPRQGDRLAEGRRVRGRRVDRDARRRHRGVQAQPAVGAVPRGPRLGLGRDHAQEPHRPELGLRVQAGRHRAVRAEGVHARQPDRAGEERAVLDGRACPSSTGWCSTSSPTGPCRCRAWYPGRSTRWSSSTPWTSRCSRRARTWSSTSR